MVGVQVIHLANDHFSDDDDEDDDDDGDDSDGSRYSPDLEADASDEPLPDDDDESDDEDVVDSGGEAAAAPIAGTSGGGGAVTLNVRTRNAEGGTGSGSSEVKGTKNSNRRDPDDEMDEDDDDEIIQKIMAETKKPRDHPPDIKTDDFVFDLCFHPARDLLAVGTIAGDIVLYKYTNDEASVVNTFEVHTKACRDMEFSDCGDYLISVSKDKSIMMTNVERGNLVRFYDNAHECAIYSMAMINENVFATGDDDGTVNVWDLREKQLPIFGLKIAEDYISKMMTNDHKKLILCTSGDGYLTTVNIGARKLDIQSEPYEEELTSMGIFRGDSKLVVGSSKGKLYSFNWGEFGYHNDMFPGPKSGINCMIPITDRIAVVAGEEGILRAMHVAPGRNLGIVGQHSLGVEALDICNTGEFIASSSHDNDIRFWNVKYFEDFDDIKYTEKHDKKRELKHNLPSSKYSNTADFFADLA